MRPQQLNGTDCGVFVILYGLLRSSGWDSQKIHHELKMTHAQKMRQQLKLWCSTFEKKEKAARDTLLREKRKVRQTRVKVEGESSQESISSLEQTPKKRRKE
jgi:hypothetical protein